MLIIRILWYEIKSGSGLGMRLGGAYTVMKPDPLNGTSKKGFIVNSNPHLGYMLLQQMNHVENGNVVGRWKY